MRKCPNCQKEFPDTMRFCQADGTPLVDVVEEPQAEDPLKTTVVRQEDIASSIPPSDPFKTMVATPSQKEESGDLLQLPEEEAFDPLKTMVATPIAQDKSVSEGSKSESPKFEEIKEEIKSESSPFSAFSQPEEPLPQAPSDYSNDPTLLQPEPPKFNEPNLSPPSFGDSSPKAEADEEDLPQTVMQNPWDVVDKPKSDQSPYASDSPFSKPSDSPMSSPFDAPKSSFDEPKSSFDEPKPPFEEPQSPFGQPASPFDAPKSPFDAPNETPFNQPQSSFNEPQSFEPPKPAFQEPPNQFGSAASQFEPANQGFGGNQPLQQNDWTPPPSPEAGWQNQGVGQNTPFQPPAVAGGVNQTLPIVSLVFGILSLCCYVSPLTGIVAIITGFMGMKNANTDPSQYGGKGLAIAGMVLGGLFFLVGIAYYILVFVIGMGGLLSR